MDEDRRRWSPEDVESARERLEIMEGIHAALERWPVVAALALECESEDALQRALVDLLGIGATPALAVTDLQVRSVTRRRRERIAEDVEQLRTELAAQVELRRS